MEGRGGGGAGGENIHVSSPGQSRRYMGDELVEHRLTEARGRKVSSRQTLFQELGREFPSLLDLDSICEVRMERGIRRLEVASMT